jgi:hypothetical protein
VLMYRRIAVSIVMVAFAAVLVGCGKSPNASHGATTTTEQGATTTLPRSTTPSTSTTSYPTTAVSVPVVACSTTFALATQPSTVPLPISVAVALPESMVDQVTVYDDTSNLTMLLGPKSWTCVAAYGADGSGGIDLYAPGETPPSPFSAVPSSDEAITAVESGGSPVQAAAQACPYFSAAAASTQTDLGHGCSAPPKGEKITKVSSNVVAFEDPPGTKGGGKPSGGLYLADGVLSYSDASQPGTYLATCTLPPSGQRVCAFALNYFESLYGGARPGIPKAIP